MSQSKHRNRLADETSPYLLQHADNPVDWYPWGPEALERAAREQRPILLSIGYSACHWCHVMAHESFEDEATAELMNANFVNIKVDREERPDIDRIYQLAHQLLARRPGGWPLTMFLTPDDQTPFFGGTYFPPDARHGLPGFRDLLERVSGFLAEHGDEIETQNESLRAALARADADAGGDVSGAPAFGPEPLEHAIANLRHVFDARDGGFGGAPKFPHPTNVELCLRRRRADPRDLHMGVHTLAKMALGGLYDHLGGGFYRYTVDAEWMIPHFEKMLYDNGPLLGLCARAARLGAGHEALFKRTARETGDWAIREMQSPEGGFYAALDADSPVAGEGGEGEGHGKNEEGKFYLWTPESVRAVLDDEEEYIAFCVSFGLDRPPNFEGREWHLHTFVERDALPVKLGADAETAGKRLDRARAKLFEARVPRPRPGLDDKVITSWNALMISGLVAAGECLGEPRFLDAAERAFDFLRANAWVDGRLHAVWKNGQARFPAYLDDHAFLLEASLRLLEARWQPERLEFACALADALLERFEDRERGGFWFTAHDHERLMHRSKSFADESLPSGNGIAAVWLGRLGHLLGETRYLEAAERTLAAAWPALMEMPLAHGAMLLALEEQVAPPQTVVLRGAPGDELERWRARAVAPQAPRRYVVAVPDDATGLPELLAAREPSGKKGAPIAYVCEGHRCDAPSTTFKDFEAALRPLEE